MSNPIRMTLLALLVALSTSPALVAQDPPAKPVEAKPEAAAAKPDEAKDEKKKDRWLHVKNVDVYPVVGPVLRAAEILVQNDKIAAIGHGLEAPAEAEVLDGQGFRAYPGLIALNGAGILPPARGRAADTLNPFGLQTVMALAHGITTVMLGTSAVKLQSETNEGAVIRENLYLGLFYNSSSPQQKKQLREDFRKARDFLRGQAAAAPGGAEGGAPEGGAAPPAGRRPGGDDRVNAQSLGSAARLVPVLEGKLTAMFNVADGPALLEVCELVETFRFKAVVRGAVEGWTVADSLGRTGVMAILTPRITQDPDQSLNRLTGSNLDNAGILYRHGVTVAIAVEDGTVNLDGQPDKDALTVAWEAAAAVSGGLPEQAALAAVTINAARVSGIEDRVGSLEEGKDADIVITDGDILHYRSMPQWVIVNGRIVYDKEKEPIYRNVRSRDAARKPEVQWWPRPFGPMPDEWKYDPAEVARQREKDAGKGEAPAKESPTEKPADETPKKEGEAAPEKKEGEDKKRAG